MVTTDLLIVGSGMAGLYTALHADRRLRCLVVAKEKTESSNSWLAQGGIAAAVASDDAPALHMEDTLLAGAGLCDPAAVKVLVDEAPYEIQRLADMKVPFDVNAEGDLVTTREGGHTRNRVVHAGGDATGRETVRVLASIAAQRDNIMLRSGVFLRDVLVRDGRCVGAVLWDGTDRVTVRARAVVLAAGGAGQIYHRTTNPAAATGDGVAVALRAGAKVKHMEFVQFHPTALYDPSRRGAFLISEAVRGEGARLVNQQGDLFMQGVHPMAELAPRDIVSRGILREMRRTGQPCVYLDCTHASSETLGGRFPTIYNECLRRGWDMGKDRLPVSPAQHYLVGGVLTDLFGQSTLPGLYACGETACTGVHGANRLASNSMLECLVFGRRVALTAGELPLPGESHEEGRREPPTGRDQDAIGKIRDICQRDVGILRTTRGLTRGLAELEAVAAPSGDWETQNMKIVARAVLHAALARTESVGTHYREEDDGYGRHGD